MINHSLFTVILIWQLHDVFFHSILLAPLPRTHIGWPKPLIIKPSTWVAYMRIKPVFNGSSNYMGTFTKVIHIGPYNFMGMGMVKNGINRIAYEPVQNKKKYTDHLCAI